MSNEKAHRTKAGIIRMAAKQIEAWRNEGLTSTGIAAQLSEQWGIEISAANVHKEIYRLRLRRKNENKAEVPARQAPRASDIPKIDFNPKPNEADLI